MRRSFLAAAVAAAAFVLSPQAFAADVMTTISSQRLAAMLTAAGATEVGVTKPETGIEIVSFNDGNGTLDFVLTDCTDAGCPSMQMTSIFAKDERFTLGAINAYNAKYLNAQAHLMNDGKAALARLFIAAGGVTEDNLKANVAVFLAAPAQFEKHILEQLSASLGKPNTMQLVAVAKPAHVLNFGAGGGKTVESFDLIKWSAGQTNRRPRTLP